jgi:FAD/FMN-containing dehydrogenase
MSTAARPGLRIGTRLITPADRDYDAVRQPWNLAVDQRPAAVALPTDAAQVAEVVRAARAGGLRVAVQGGAHNPGPLGDLGDALLLRTSAMSGVRIDAASRIARVEAGALWDPVIAAAAEHGLYPMHGSSPNVGVVGYSLGGGLGWAARRHGLQANQIVAAELVTADGELVRVDADHAPELFWALRGGGDGFGVVTALEFTLLPISTAYAGWLAWDWTESERVLTAWAEWARDAPEAVTSSARIIKVPPLPDVPEPIRGRQLAAIDGAVLGTGDEEAAAMLNPLRALRPEIDTFSRMPATALARLHGDPEQPTPAVSDTAMLGPLDATAIASLVDAAGPQSGSSLLLAELRQLGGALGRPAQDAGALSALDGDFVLFALALAPDPESAQAGAADARTLIAAMRPWLRGRRYANFVEVRADAEEFHDAATFARLERIRDTVDPDGLFLTAHGRSTAPRTPTRGTIVFRGALGDD